jgi:hypothetical protein
MGGMEFNFLPNLPKSDLDDRKFEDLVEECLPRIPRYCPEWTNHNPSDPGITLVELFSWLTDQMLARFNQVPRRQYIAFLELLGIRLQPPPHGGHPPFPCPHRQCPATPTRIYPCHHQRIDEAMLFLLVMAAAWQKRRRGRWVSPGGRGLVWQGAPITPESHP